MPGSVFACSWPTGRLFFLYTQLDASQTLDDLKNPPGNRLESLKGNRIGQMSIRINNQWRVCFVWEDAEAHDVEIVDYH